MIVCAIASNGTTNHAPIESTSEPMIIMCALLAEAFFKVSIPIVEVPEARPADLLRTGDRVRIDGARGVVEVLPRA